MAQLRLKGIAQYAPGLWGVAVPASGVSIDIIDLDANPASNDTIWMGVTGGDGRFAGTSREWRDTVTIGFGSNQRQVADATDVLALSARVTDNFAGRRREITLPFQFIRDDFLSPPLVLPWEPPNAIKGKVNGIPCWTLNEFVERAKSAVQSGNLASIEVFGALLVQLESAITQALNLIKQSSSDKKAVEEKQAEEEKQAQLARKLKYNFNVVSTKINQIKTIPASASKIFSHKVAAIDLNPANKFNLGFKEANQKAEIAYKQALIAALNGLVAGLLTLNAVGAGIEAAAREGSLLIINTIIATLSSVAGSLGDIITQAMSSVVSVVANLGGSSAYVSQVATLCIQMLAAAFLSVVSSFSQILIRHEQSLMVLVEDLRG